MASTIKLSITGGTDPGVKRPNNEDFFTDQPPNCAPEVVATKGLLYIVADGVGGNEAGEVASRMAVELTRLYYYQDPNPDIRASLIAAIEEANRQIYRQALGNSAQHGMGTTITAVVLHGMQFYVANVGDSRTYLLRAGRAESLTRDHTWVAEKVAEGLISPAEAASHPQRNIITRSLGHELAVRVDCSGPFSLQPGDQLLLCTDGLSDLVPAPELVTTASGSVPQEAVRRLIALARQRGAPDNVTVLIVSAVSQNVRRAPAAMNWTKAAPWFLGALLLIGVIYGGGTLLRKLPPGRTPLPSLTADSASTPSSNPTPGAVTPTTSETVDVPELVKPEEGETFLTNQDITLRWGYRDLPSDWHFQVVLADSTGTQEDLPNEGVVRELFLTLPGNSLSAGTYRWFVLVLEMVEGEDEERGRSTPREFTVRTPVSATPISIPTIVPTLESPTTVAPTELPTDVPTAPTSPPVRPTESTTPAPTPEPTTPAPTPEPTTPAPTPEPTTPAPTPEPTTPAPTPEPTTPAPTPEPTTLAPTRD